MLLKGGSEYPVGLDISDYSLKLVQLNKSGDSVTLQGLNKIDLPAGIIVNGEIKKRADLIKAFKDVAINPKYGVISSNEVTACLPDNLTFIKLIEVDSGPNDLKETVISEMEKHIPLPLDDIYFDWQKIGEKNGKSLILLGAAPKSIVNEYSQILDEAGFSIFALEIESSSICRALLAEEHYKYKGAADKNYAILDIGAKRTSMIIYSNNTILFTVSLPISGEVVTQKISDNLKIERDQAERAKIICGLDSEKAQGVIKDILSNLIDELVQKINGVITYYQSHFPGYGQLQQIILCGGGSNIENIDKILSEALNMPVTLANPLINLKEKKEKIDIILSETYNLNLSGGKKKSESELSLTQNSSLAFATAIGLALRGIFIDEL